MDAGQKATAKRLISRACESWTDCDWTHERRDHDGDTVCEDDGSPVYCAGGEYDDCGYCEEADDAAQSAQEHGREAIEALDRGDVEAATQAVQQARDLESHWGDTPAWGPVAQFFADLN